MTTVNVESVDPKLLAFLQALPAPEREKLLHEAMQAAGNRKRKAARPAMPFSEFKLRFWHGFQPAPFDPAIDHVLQGVADYVLTGGAKGISRAMFFLPPRSGKTQRISRLFPAWLYSQKPDMRALIASYSLILARANSRYIRNLIGSQAFQDTFPDTKLGGVQGADYFETSAAGSLLAAGVASTLAGHGGVLGIVDDPVKSRAEAESAVWRARLKEWWQSDWLSRIEEPGGAIIVCQTRWHEDDLAGWLLATDDDDNDAGDGWHVLRLPAIAEDTDAIGRAPGQALWPAKYPLTWLEKQRTRMGEYAFAALYQQRPTKAGGNAFKWEWFDIVEAAPPLSHTVRAFDLAMSDKTSADATASVKMGYDDNGHIYILDVTQKRVDFGALAGYLAEVIMGDSTAVPQGIENKGYMSRAIQQLATDAKLSRFQIAPYNVEGDKVTRALPLAARAAAGIVHLVRGHWNQRFLDELCAFPNAPHDDMVDAASGAYAMLYAGESNFDGAVSHTSYSIGDTIYG